MKRTQSQIVESICGRSANMYPNADILVEYKKIRENGEQIEINNLLINTAELDIYKIGNYVEVNVIFMTGQAIHLHQLQGIVDNYKRDVAASTEKLKEIPMLFLTMVSALQKEDYVVAVSPVNYNFSTVANTEKVAVRLLFEVNDFMFFTMKEEDRVVAFDDIEDEYAFSEEIKLPFDEID